MTRESISLYPSPRNPGPGEVGAKSIPVTLDAAGRITIDGQKASLSSIRPLLERRLRSRPGLAVVMVADKAVSIDRVVRVMDEVRAAGIARIALATVRKEQPEHAPQ